MRSPAEERGGLDGAGERRTALKAGRDDRSQLREEREHNGGVGEREERSRLRGEMSAHGGGEERLTSTGRRNDAKEGREEQQTLERERSAHGDGGYKTLARHDGRGSCQGSRREKNSRTGRERQARRERIAQAARMKNARLRRREMRVVEEREADGLSLPVSSLR